MQKWKKLGRIFEPVPSLHPKLLSHAANPLPMSLGGSVFRIFYNGRDARNRSSVASFEFDMAVQRVLRVRSEPDFEHGPEDSFYGDGVSVGCIYRPRAGDDHILFMGWQNRPGAHWRGDIGRLHVSPHGRLSLRPAEPLLGATDQDPISLSYPSVICIGSEFLMWYGSTINWDAGNGEMLHVIRGARSLDGESWTRAPELDVPYEIGVAQAFSRPSVIMDSAGTLEMWFSYRSGTGRPYRIGRASSMDGTGWRLRLDEAGIDVSSHGWDSEMIEYPHVFEHNGERFMLYNGNSFGRSGIGLGVWQ